MEHILKQILQKLESMDKSIQDNTTAIQGTNNELKEFRKEFQQFQGVATNEFDRVSKKLDTITKQTADNIENTNYLAGEVGKHGMILNRLNQQ